MSWKNDAHGLVFKSSEIKLFMPGHTWQMKLGQFLFHDNRIRLITYTLPDVQYIEHFFARRPHDIWLVAHRRSTQQAIHLKKLYPDIEIAVHPSVHSKVALVEPKTVYVSSANFGYNGPAYPDQQGFQWHETSIGVRSQEAHDWYLEQVFQPLWRSSQQVPHPSSELFLSETTRLLRESQTRWGSSKFRSRRARLD